MPSGPKPVPKGAALTLRGLLEKIEALGGSFDGLDEGAQGIGLVANGARTLVTVGRFESTSGLEGRLSRLSWVCPSPKTRVEDLIGAMRELASDGDLPLCRPIVVHARIDGPFVDHPKEPARRILVFEAIQ